MPALKLENLQVCQDGHASTTVSADFCIGRKHQRVSFKVLDQDAICTLADPFLPVALIPAMRRNWAIHSNIAVSRQLFEGAHKAQQVLHGWYPDFKKIEIEMPQTETPAAKQTQGVATFFSGGVDSFYTLHKHQNDITHLIFVHGFDIPLSNLQERQRASQSVRQVADDLGLQLVEVETNLRQFGQSHVSWAFAYFGAALGAVALLLSPRFKRIYLPASVSSDQLVPMGSHPELDPCWNNANMQLDHDGLSATRFAKVRDIGHMPEARKHLRVCYQNAQHQLNCCRCRKCLWTMMMLKASGDLEQFDSFAAPLDPAELQLYPPVPSYERDRFSEAITLLKARSAEPEFQNLLQDMLDANGKIPLRGKLKRLLTRGRTYLAHRF